MTDEIPRTTSRKSQIVRTRRQLDADVYTLACQRVAYAFDTFDHVLVAFSGGKDSTAVLNVALDVARSDPSFHRHLPLRVMFQDEEAIPIETEQYVRRVAQRDDVALEWYCLPIQHRNACSRTSPWWWPWAPEARELWCRPLPPEAITHLDGFPIYPPEARLTAPDMMGLFAPPERGNTAFLMGIRAQESMTRLRAVMSVGATGHNYVIKFDEGTSRGNIFKVYPIYDWKTTDVWTAPARFGWDYNAAYDRMEMAGVSRPQQRCSPAFGEEPLEKLWTYSRCFPEVWDKMTARVPGVGAAARYALTELYSYRDRPEKPVGVPWPDFITHYLGKFRPGEAEQIGRKLQEEIHLHYRKTTHPIVVNAPHPHTGMCWNWVLTVAMRGDFKNRKRPSMKVHADEQGRAVPAAWHKYATELDRILRTGTFGELAHPGRPPRTAWDLVPAYARQEAQ